MPGFVHVWPCGSTVSKIRLGMVNMACTTAVFSLLFFIPLSLSLPLLLSLSLELPPPLVLSFFKQINGNTDNNHKRTFGAEEARDSSKSKARGRRLRNFRCEMLIATSKTLFGAGMCPPFNIWCWPTLGGCGTESSRAAQRILANFLGPVSSKRGVNWATCGPTLADLF